MAKDATTRSVGIYVDKYFNAINAHDYDAYYALFDSQIQEGMTPSSFSSGYSTTRDTDEVLQSISSDDGYTVADLTFTSYQSVSQSSSGSSCTAWSIELFLEPDGASYLDVAPPDDAGYHAQSQACG